MNISTLHPADPEPTSSLDVAFVRTRSGPEFAARLDEQIRAVYTGSCDAGAVSDLAKRIGKPRWWVSRRAGELGLTRPRLAPAPWSDEEREIVEILADAGLAGVSAGLAAAGFKRTAGAITMELKRQRISRTPKHIWSARTLGEFMGVDSKTVGRWIIMNGLPASQDGHSWKIRREDFKAWVQANPDCFDMRKADQAWFISVLGS